MGVWESVSEEEFAAAIAGSGASAAFGQEYARFEPPSYDGDGGPSFKVFRGDLSVAGHWKAPGLQTLVIGDLLVDGLVDLANPYEEGFDEGGQFVVIGDVACRGFIGEGGKCVFIDGDLTASEIVANDFEDASLSVIGELRTRFFLGLDIWASVGGRAEIEAGDGYCMPLGDAGAEEGIVRPRLGEDESYLMLKPEFGATNRDDEGNWRRPTGLSDAIRDAMAAGGGIFRGQ